MASPATMPAAWLQRPYVRYLAVCLLRCAAVALRDGIPTAPDCGGVSREHPAVTYTATAQTATGA